MFNKKKSGHQPPEYRKPTPPPPPTTGSNAFKPNPNYTPPSTIKTTCTYETPCGWCTKWDKKCDKKIGESVKPYGYFKETKTNKTCQSEEDHQWECCGVSTVDCSYTCKKCGAYKTVSYTSSTSNGYQGE